MKKLGLIVVTRIKELFVILFSCVMIPSKPILCDHLTLGVKSTVD